MEERLEELLKLALKYKATDIHFFKRFSDVAIKMRIDGELKNVVTKPGDDKLMRYLQYRADLDVGKLLFPQTGGFEQIVNGELVSLRYSVITSNNVEDGVLRILESGLNINISNLSSIKKQNLFFEKIIKKKAGLVLLSGPTGSGKTTTLYSLLKGRKNAKIYTIEDPIEVYHDNFVQLQVNEELGFDYANGIKQILRHDPDVILIGEIRDEKAAKMAVSAANTGHLVLSTIHANKASSCISRMVELGVNEEHLYEVLCCLSNQRMMYDQDHKRIVFYEIMDQDEINYYRKNKKNSDNFLSMDKQIREGEKNGIVEFYK